MNKLLLVLISATAMLAAACTTTPPPSNCIEPAGKLVDAAFSRARSSLGYPECWSQFNGYFESLLQTAEGDPKEENLAQFSEFVGWSVERGIVTRIEGSELFTAYFSPNFVALPNDRSVCSAVRTNPRLAADVESELELKYRGLVKVAGLNATYAQAAREQASLDQILGAMESACQ